MARSVCISYAGSGVDAGLLSSPVPNAPKSRRALELGFDQLAYPEADRYIELLTVSLHAFIQGRKHSHAYNFSLSQEVLTPSELCR